LARRDPRYPARHGAADGAALHRTDPIAEPVELGADAVPKYGQRARIGVLAGQHAPQEREMTLTRHTIGTKAFDQGRGDVGVAVR